MNLDDSDDDIRLYNDAHRDGYCKGVEDMKELVITELSYNQKDYEKHSKWLGKLAEELLKDKE